MNNYKAIQSLTEEQLEKFLDQVFLTGYNTGHQSIVDTELTDENPFDKNWLNKEVEAPQTLF